MSLILEALKKSEAARRLGEAPGLGTPITATRRRRRVLPWLILVALLAVATTGWWMLHVRQTPAVQTAGLNAQPSKPAKPAANSTRPAITNILAETPPNPDRRTTAPHPAVPTASPAAPPPGIVSAAPTAIAPRGPAPSLPGPPPPQSPAAPPPAPPVVPGIAPVAPPAPATQAPAKAAALPVVTAPVATAPVAPPVAEAPYENVQNIEDLPYSVRKDIPDLPISMQVYSIDAARRFVIINGIRKVEGEMVKDAVLLHEVRPNGVVLEFHGQRFFMPRPGS